MSTRTGLVALGVTLIVLIGISVVVLNWPHPASVKQRAVYLNLAWEELHIYNLDHGALPADVRSKSGVPISSWRFLASDPHMFATPFDRSTPWDSPANSGASQWPYHVYCLHLNAPSGPKDLETKVLAVTGEGTGFSPSRPQVLEELPNDLILLVEVWGTGVHWMQPGDIDVTQGQRIPLSGPDGRGACVTFADGAVWYLRSDVPKEAVEKFCTIEGARKHDRTELLRDFAEEFYPPKRHPKQ